MSCIHCQPWPTKQAFLSQCLRKPAVSRRDDCTSLSASKTWGYDSRHLSLCLTTETKAQIACLHQSDRALDHWDGTSHEPHHDYTAIQLSTVSPSLPSASYCFHQHFPLGKLSTCMLVACSPPVPGEAPRRAISFARKGIPAAPCGRLWRVSKMHSDFIRKLWRTEAGGHWTFLLAQKGAVFSICFHFSEGRQHFCWDSEGAAGVLVTFSSL